MVKVAALAARLAVWRSPRRHAGHFATAPLPTLSTVTDAVSGPPVRPTRLVTVSVVAVAVLTVPVAPPINLTTSCRCRRIEAETVNSQGRGCRQRLALAVTTGITVATGTGSAADGVAGHRRSQAARVKPLRPVTVSVVAVALVTFRRSADEGHGVAAHGLEKPKPVNRQAGHIRGQDGLAGGHHRHHRRHLHRRRCSTRRP